MYVCYHRNSTNIDHLLLCNFTSKWYFNLRSLLTNAFGDFQKITKKITIFFVEVVIANDRQEISKKCEGISEIVTQNQDKTVSCLYYYHQRNHYIHCGFSVRIAVVLIIIYRCTNATIHRHRIVVITYIPLENDAMIMFVVFTLSSSYNFIFCCRWHRHGSFVTSIVICVHVYICHRDAFLFQNDD